jgi:hypothetical protein
MTWVEWIMSAVGMKRVIVYGVREAEGVGFGVEMIEFAGSADTGTMRKRTRKIRVML